MLNNVLITGSRGYMGRALIYELNNPKNRRKESDPYCIDEDKVDSITECDIKIHPDDDFSNIECFVGYQKIIHLAADISVSESQKDPVKYINNNTFKVLKMINKLERENHLIFASTNSVHSDSIKIEPKSTYGMSKFLTEEIIRSKSNYKMFSEELRRDMEEKANVPQPFVSTILRIANPIGILPCHEEYLDELNVDNANVLFKLANCKVNNEEFQIHNFPGMTRDFINIKDIVSFIKELIFRGENTTSYFKTYNLGSNKTIEIVPLLEFLCKENNIKYRMVDPPAGTFKGYTMNSTNSLQDVLAVTELESDFNSINKIFKEQYIPALEKKKG